MSAHIVETIAHDEMSGKLITAISQSCLRFRSHIRTIEGDLFTAPASRQTIAHAFVGIQVKTLPTAVVDDCGSRKPLKTVNDENIFICFGLITNRQNLRGETLPTTVYSRYFEAIDNPWS